MKFYGIIIFYLVYCELITQQVFQNEIGFQQLKLDTLLSKKLDQDYKYSLKLQATISDKPTLLVCETSPKFSTNSKLDDVIEKYNCLTDKLNYQKTTQYLTLSNEDTPQLLKNYFHVYQLATNNPTIGIYSKNQATYQISLVTIQNQECVKKCQNDGKCVNGYCQCLIGYFYDDCSIVGTLFNDIQSLQPQIVYYLPTNRSTSFQMILSDSVEYLQSCVAINPNMEATVTTYLKNINIPESTFNDCENYTNELAESLHFQIFGAIMIKILSDQVVYLSSPQTDTNNSNNTIALSISIPFCIAIMICICCVCILKKRKSQRETQKTENNEVKQLIDIYMPIQQYNAQAQPDEKPCTICLEVFRNNEQIRITYCQHTYHSSCIVMWMKKHQVLFNQ